MPSTPFFLENLTDAAWQKISEKSGLPNEARPKIDEALHLYKSWQQAKRHIKPPSVTREDLRTLAKKLDQAAEQLSSVLSNQRAKVTLIDATIKASAGAVLKHEEAESSVEGWVSQIEDMRAKILHAEKWIAGGRRGDWEQALALTMFVQKLDQILFEFTGKNIDRSYKGHQTSRDYLTAVCKVADREITASSVEEAMKTVMQRPGDGQLLSNPERLRLGPGIQHAATRFR
jgi:hypothetical protein